MLKKIFMLVILNFLIFFSVGKVMFDKEIDVSDKLEPFLDSLENTKIGAYYFHLGNMQKLHKYLSIEFINSTGTIKKVCYEIQSEKLERTAECENDIQIILDEHATSTIILGSMRPFNVLFSEFLMGHVKFEGLTFYDLMMVLKW